MNTDGFQQRQCPTCGHCPTCGRGGYYFSGPWWGITPPPTYAPWPGWPNPYITCDSGTIISTDTSRPIFQGAHSAGVPMTSYQCQ